MKFVVFCDNHLLVVFKQAGLSTQPHEEGQDNITDRAKAWIKKEYNKPGKVFLEPVHRLDKPVSGLVLFARTSKALSRLQELMRTSQIKKTYTAFVEGTPPEREGTLEHFLVHDEYKARAVSSSHKEGKLARLHYKVLTQYKTHALVEIVLETGRYHQIRAQVSAIGCPVVGDGKYGSVAKSGLNHIFLHHGRLEFIHPVTKEPLSFEVKPVWQNPF